MTTSAFSGTTPGTGISSDQGTDTDGDGDIDGVNSAGGQVVTGSAARSGCGAISLWTTLGMAAMWLAF